MSKHNTGSFVLGAIFGAAVASVTTLLFAPQSGEKTRQDIVDKTQETRDQANEYFDIAKEKGNEFYKNVRETGEQYFNQASKQAEETFSQAKDQVEDKVDDVKKDIQSGGKTNDVYESRADAEEGDQTNPNKISQEKSEDEAGYI